MLSCFFFIFVRKYRNATVHMVCDSSPFKMMLEFMRRHSLAKGVIDFSVMCIILTDYSFYVGCLIYRRSTSQKVR